MDWKKIKTEYIAGGTSYRKLAEKHTVPFHTLRKKAAKEHWKDLRDEAAAKAATKIVELEANRQADRYERLLRVSDDLLDVVEEAVRSFKVGDLLLDRTALKSLSGTIKDIKDIQNIKTELDIEEQKARIANLKRQAEKDEESKDIVVKIEADAEEYSR